MGIKTYNPYTPSRRNMTGSDFSEITKKTPEKSLLASKKKNSGRNNQGKITVRHHGGGNRQKYRLIDFKRNKDGIPAKVIGIEYDPKHFDFLTNKPFIVVFLGTSEIRKLAGKSICCLQTFQVLHTVERFHLKSFVCPPNELLLEIRPFQVCGNFLHPLLSGNGRKVGEEFFFTVCHSLFKI